VSRKRKRNPRRLVPCSPDPRQIAAAVSDDTFVFAVSPVRIDGRIVFYYSPAVVDFYLLEAKRLSGVGEKKRKRALSTLRKEDDGSFRPKNPSAVLDAVADVTTAVFLSVSAIEAFANIMIEDLPGDTKIYRGGGKALVVHSEMVRRLTLSEKLDLAVPLATCRPSAKGTQPWERFIRLYRLRNELTHVKDGGYSKEPDSPSGFGRLVRGDGRTCVDDAVAIIEACDPEWPSAAVKGRG
jgi:hypothetical protein